jgi:ornithine cyclodeaminase/alanine dehydrogenase-like protein (mu-crystallin family)
MLVLNAEQVRARAPMAALIGALREAFRGDCVAPVRQLAKVPGGAAERLFLCMPAFASDGGGIVKLVTVFPDNARQAVPTVQAALVVFSASGTPVAVLDGTMVTYLRTGAASALASTYLSREDSSHLVVIGTGGLAPYMALAHATVRPIRRISVCGRSAARAALTAAAVRSLLAPDVDVIAADSAEAAVATADIVCCATRSATPVLAGKWLRAGVLVDLVGSFSPATREADDDVVRGSRIFVDTFAGALTEAGDLLDPLRRGVIARERIEGQLADLVTQRVRGRVSGEEIVTFKSVGSAIEDLAAAQMIVTAPERGLRRQR